MCAEGGLFGRPLKGKEKGAMRVFFFTPRRAEKLKFFLSQNKNNNNLAFIFSGRNNRPNRPMTTKFLKQKIKKLEREMKR